ncbi:MAG: RNA polymerase factor sigma-54 [Treponema sp.]|nr:RNA polymerase factor sigma-54 [Treponema sp.]
MPNFDLQQRQILSQAQVLSQRQIQSLELLSLATDDIRERIYRAVEENPALVITKDALASGVDVKPVRSMPHESTYTTTRTSAAGARASDTFQSTLEAKPDERHSLQEHLLFQLHLLPLDDTRIRLGERLIHNLDSKGFHVLAPLSLLDPTQPQETPALLEECIKIIQQFDPVGTCTKNTEESLFVQAQSRPNAPQLALFLLNGHLSFLNPPQAIKILKKIKTYQAEQKTLFARTTPDAQTEQLNPSEESVQTALNFIKTLDPYPARDYSTEGTLFIAPDVYVEPLAESYDEDNEAKGIVVTPEKSWLVRTSRDRIPQVAVNPEFSRFLKHGSTLSKDGKKLVETSIKRAEDFLDTLEFRAHTVQRACAAIVKHQHLFFAKGPGNLLPLRQQDIAQQLGVHETTISRMASSKYLQCEWGLFEIKYFFTNAAVRSAAAAPTSEQSASRDKVIFTMQRILEEHKNDKKKLSDQKLAELLAKEGMAIARRTVAKYRSQLNIESSFNR